MNTQLTVVKSFGKTDDLVILADRKNNSWQDKYLSSSDIKVFKNVSRNGSSSVLIPQEKRNVIIQFLAKHSDHNITREETRLAGNDLLSFLSHYRIEEVTIVNECNLDLTSEFVEGMMLGNYQFLKYFKDKKGKSNTLSQIKIERKSIAMNQFDELNAILFATCKARDLVNEPQSYLSASQLSKEIQSIGKKSGFKVKVYKKAEIIKMKMGGLLAVNMGSISPPTFNVLEWKPKKCNNKKPIVLVGKGIVYDTGGVSLKPTANSMDMMKSDMAGAAAVIGTMSAISHAKLPLHVVALIPSTDNRPGNDAYVPGDVITMHSGSTVEVLNTDAEGRLILADALHYAKKYKPELVLDFATLTGSAMKAFGPEAICYMGNAGKTTKQKMEKSGFSVYERLIELPLWKEYGEQLKSNIADLKNLGGSSAGMITAGKFLEHFTDYPWLHFDIAGSAYLQKTDGYRTKEGTGAGVRLMFDFLKNY